MSIEKTTMKWITVSLITLVLGSVAFFAEHNPKCHARLSLLSKGYVNVQLKEPSQADMGLRPHVFVSKLVFAKDEYLGYIDPYANFVPKTEQSMDLQTEGRIMVSLYALQMICGVVFLIAIGFILSHWRRHLSFAKERNLL